MNTPNFNRLFERSNTNTLVLIPDNFTIVACTDDYLKVTQRSREQLIGKPIFEAFPDFDNQSTVKDKRTALESFRYVVEHKQTDQMAIQRYSISKSGEQGDELEIRYWRTVNHPLLDSEGNLEYILHTVEDVTAAVSAKAALSESEFLQRLAGEVAKLGSWRIDLKTHSVFWSAEIYNIVGKPLDIELNLEIAMDCYHPDVREEVAAIVERAIENRKAFNILTRILRPDGEERWVRVIGEAELDDAGEPRALRGAFQDVSEFIHARDRADNIARQLHNALENMSDGFYLLNADWLVVFMNPQAEKLLTRSSEELVGKNVWEQFPEAVDSSFYRNYTRAVNEQVTVTFTEYFSPLQAWFQVSAYPGKDGLAVYFRDITEQRDLDDRLRQSQKLEAVGHLTGGVSHDFNNLLTVIMGNAELVSEQLDEQSRLKPLVDLIVKAAGRGAELTQRLLAFARRQPLEPQVINVAELIQSMHELLERTLTENMDIKVLCKPDLWLTEADPSQLEAALLNLVINARDAMPEGGNLLIEAENTHLDSDVIPNEDVIPGDYILISVSDTGTGMARDILEKAVEPFYTTKAKGKGSGLGLSMVHGFIKQSGGHINIYSELNLGTLVKLYLPRTNNHEELEKKELTDISRSRGQEHILVVEDDELVLQSVLSQLERLGYRVSSATSGESAYKWLQANGPVDLLFTDVVMPGELNGPELAKKAKTLQPNLKVLFTSGYSENAITHAGRLDKGVQLLSKPYHRQALAEKIRFALDK